MNANMKKNRIFCITTYIVVYVKTQENKDVLKEGYVYIHFLFLFF